MTKRFTFDENHHVGLVLFDQVLRWKTARSATIAQDPSLVARPAPGGGEALVLGGGPRHAALGGAPPGREQTGQAP